MKHKNYFSLYAVLAAMFSFMLPVTTQAQEDDVLTLKLNTGVASNAVTVTEDEGVFTVIATGGDPYVGIDGLTRDLRGDEATLTFEYKSNRDDGVEIFFSRDAAYTFAAGYSLVLGTAPATDEWEQVKIDLSTPRFEWGWGDKGFTMRLDPGATAGLTFQIRNIKITNEKIDGADLSKYNFTLNEAGAIQLNAQADFDNWVKACNDFISSLYVPMMTVDLNTDVVAQTTGGCFVENFRGTFNGHGHKVTFDVKNETESFGLGLFHYLEGTVKDLVLSGTIEGNGVNIGTLAMDLNDGGYAENIYSDVTIISHTASTTAYHGGIFGRTPGGVLKNAVFAGAIKNPDGVTSGCGGIVGNSVASSITIMENVIMAGDISEVAEGSNTITTLPENTSGTNVLALSEASVTPEWCEVVTPEQLSNGRVCFMMNGDQSNIVWYQTLGEDIWPVMDKTHKQVYADGALNCDGTPAGGKTTYNNEGGAEVPPHEYEDGVCITCGHVDENYVPVLELEQDEEGYYLINDADEFMAFAKGVNAGEFREANARLTDDVDLSGYEYIPIGWTTECYNKGAAVSEEPGYAGIFDGQGHVVYNATAVNNSAYVTSGIFGTVTGTVRNLGVSGYVWVNNYSGRHGGLVGSLVDGLVENCYIVDSRIEHTSSGEIVSGLVGFNGGTIQNCYEYNNSIMNYSRAGMLVGDNCDDNNIRMGKVINCYSQQYVTGEGRSGGYVGGGKTNCEDHVSAERFQSGEIAYKLNGSVFTPNPVWRQEVGSGYPVQDPDMPIIVVTLKGTSMDVSAEDGLAEFAAAIAEEEYAFLAESTIQNELKESYTVLVEQMEGEVTAETFTALLDEMAALRAQLVASANAYAAYQAKVAEIQAYLESHDDFEGEGRDLLNTYLTETIEPDSTQFPNGSYPYIIENLLLNVESLSNENVFVQELLDKAIATGYLPGADVTNLIVNADFANGTNGWTTNGLSITNVADIAVKHVGENASRLSLSQTLENLHPGLYEITAYAVYRADGYNQSYAQNSFVFAGDSKVYTTTLVEGTMPADVENADKFTAITDVDGNITGYLPTNGTQMAHAFSAGLYKHTVVAEVGEDGILTLGVSTPGCETANQTWVGPFTMTYCGEATSELSVAALDRMLACQVERLNVLANNYPAYVEELNNYNVAPNYPTALKDQVAQAIAAAPGSAEEKLAQAKAVSALMQEIYDAKEAYIGLMNKGEMLQMMSAELFVAGIIDETEAGRLDEVYINIINTYFEGTMSKDEALAFNPFDGTNFMPAIVDNVVQITNGVELTMFSAMVNAGMAEGLNAVLKNDIDMSAITFYPPIGYCGQGATNGGGGEITVPGFTGVFDGQGYSIKNLKAVYNSGYASSGVFGNNSGTIRNLIVDGYDFQFGDQAAYSGRHGALCGQNFGLIENCAVVNSIVDHTGEIVSGIAAGNYGGLVRACFEAQNNISPYSRAGHLIGDNRDDNSQRLGQAVNCYSANYVTGEGRSGGYTGGKTDCRDKATFTTGEIAFLLNQANEGHPECIEWKQNIGEDLTPVLDQTHKTVYEIEGGYSNYQGINNELYLAAQTGRNMLKTIHFVGGDGEKLITSADQLSTNCQWQGYNISTVIDGDLSTYFHSNADGDGQAQFSAGQQWMQVDLYTEVAGIYMEYSGRGDGDPAKNWHDTPNKIRILATNTPSNEDSWKEITVVEYPEIPNENNAYFKNSEPIMLGGAYKHLRFNILQATSNNPYWNITEFQLYSASTSTTSYYDEHPEIQAAADAVQTLCDAADEKLNAGSGTEQDVAELKAAIAALRALIPASVIPHEGTEDDPIQIATLEELTSLRGMLKKDKKTYVVLTADIDMAGVENWTPLNTGNDGHKNFIDFDGQGHVIRNFTCTNAAQQYNSFFGILCGDVSNVGFENATVSSPGSGSGIVAAWVGHEVYSEVSTMHNVWVTGKIDAGTGYVGGLIGSIGGPAYIKNVYANVDVTGAVDYMGGIVGRVRGQLTLLNAYAAGTIAQGGGIVGGGQREDTPGAIYKNIVVWNNTDQNFGTLIENVDQTENISYYNGSNFGELQSVVVSWGAPWACDMAEGSYPTFDMATGIQGVTNTNAKGKIYNINGIQVEKTTKGLYIIDGKKVMVK